MENKINLDLISNYSILKELSNHEKIKNVETCEDHDDTTKLIYDLKEKIFLCSFCSIYKNFDSLGVIDIKKLISKKHWNLLSETSQELMKNSKKTDSSKILLEVLQEKKRNLTKIYEDLVNEARKNYELTLAKIEKMIESLNYDALHTKCQSNLLEIQLNNNKINLDSILFKISEIHESIYLLSELNQIDNNEIESNKINMNEINNSLSNLKVEMVNFFEIFSSENSKEIINLNLKDNIPQFNSKIENRLQATYGKVCMDSNNYGKNEKIYLFDGYETTTIQIYQNYDAFLSNTSLTGQLPCQICGTYNIVFNNCIYARKGPWSNSQTITKICLNSMTIKAENKINNFNFKNSALQWGGGNDHFFLTNGKELFLIYNKDNNSLGLCKICPETLQIKRNFYFEVKPKDFGSVFMIYNKIYFTKLYSESPTKIYMSINIVNQEVDKLDLIFSNTGGYDTSLHYCYPKKQLWTVNNKIFYTYDLEKNLK